MSSSSWSFIIIIYYNQPQISELPEFGQLGITNGPCVYDSTIEHIFAEASKYFNLKDDPLHIGVFWFPEKSKKT